MLNRILIFTGLTAFSMQVIAGSLPDPRNFPVGKPTLACVEQAAIDHQVPFALLLGVNSIERGSTGQDVGNTNGTLDTGAFQINSIHFPRAEKLNATHNDLATRGCYNAQFAAMLLSEALGQRSKQHLDFYTRGAGYHSWTPKYNKIYRAKLVKYTTEWQDWLLKNSATRTTQTQQHSLKNPRIGSALSAQPVSYQPKPKPNPFNIQSAYTGRYTTIKH